MDVKGAAELRAGKGFALTALGFYLGLRPGASPRALSGRAFSPQQGTEDGTPAARCRVRLTFSALQSLTIFYKGLTHYIESRALSSYEETAFTPFVPGLRFCADAVVLRDLGHLADAGNRAFGGVGDAFDGAQGVAVEIGIHIEQWCVAWVYRGDGAGFYCEHGFGNYHGVDAGDESAEGVLLPGVWCFVSGGGDGDCGGGAMMGPIGNSSGAFFEHSRPI